jgi:hypothetical protein
MSTLQFYAERAADCRRQADAANLENVRARCLSAASAWDDMADRVRRTQVYREEDASRKAAHQISRQVADESGVEPTLRGGEVK